VDRAYQGSVHGSASQWDLCVDQVNLRRKNFRFPLDIMFKCTLDATKSHPDQERDREFMNMVMEQRSNICLKTILSQRKEQTMYMPRSM